MSADVQPRKRKDKKKKRDSLDSKSEEELITRKLSLKDEEDTKDHHGVHSTKMGADDVHLHIQGEHTTGGHWCAKIFFFSLLAILFGLIGLIILENRGLSDLDTPLSESRFSEYFEGWVDEHRQTHDDHGKIPPELEDHDAEPFEEEEDHSEIDEDEDHEEPDDEHDQHGDEETVEQSTEQEEEEEEEKSTNEELTIEDTEEDQEEDELNDTQENQTNEANDEEEEEEENDTIQPSEEVVYSRNKHELKSENDDDDENVDEGFGDMQTDDEDDNNLSEEVKTRFESEEQATQSQAPPSPSSAPVEEDPYDEAVNPINASTLKMQIDELSDIYNEVAASLNKTENDNSAAKCKEKADNSEQVCEKRVEDDDDFESLEEHVVDNDAYEQALLEQKAKEAQDLVPSAEEEEKEEDQSSSITLKVFVGVALAFVARLVLIKNTNTSVKSDSTGVEDESNISMRRRFSMVTAEEPIPLDHDEPEPDDLDEEYLEEEYEDEEDEEGEEGEADGGVEYSEDDNVAIKKYVPETFEQLNAMYRPKGFEYTKSSGIEELKAKMEDIKPKIEETKPKINEIRQTIEEIKPKIDYMISRKEELIKKFEQFTPDKSQNESEVTKMKREDEEQEEDIEEEMSEGEEDEEEDLDEEELSEEEDVSDVDDTDLMKRLEAKYGKLPQKQYDSEEDGEEDKTWTKIKSRPGGGPQAYTEDDFIEEQLRRANDEMLQNNLQSALKIYETLSLKYPDVPGALYGKAKALDRLSESFQSNQILMEAIMAYKRFLALDSKIDNEIFKEAAERCIDRMRFKGLNLQAVQIHEMLIKRFPNDPTYRNQLALTYLLINRLADAKKIVEQTLMQWPNNGLAQVHYGFILKILDKDLERSVKYLWKGIKSEENGTQDGRFYFNLGDALQRLGRTDEAREIYRDGARKKLFLSEYQRSLYNVDNLKAQPFWTKDDTTYIKYFNEIERNWEKIKEEGLNALNAKGFFIDEAESLRDFGDWKQFELFSRGYKNKKNCLKAPITCALIETFPAARFCKRGQTKFSVMHPNTHVWPHCGPTNCRIRAHLGLKIPDGTKIRVANEMRNWEEGKFLIFDDSFEHEVWHNGTSLRLVLIIDVWHPELTEEQRNSLSPI